MGMKCESNAKSSSLRGDSTNRRSNPRRFVIARKCVAFSWQSKSRESNQDIESMTQKRINELDSPLQQNDSNNFASSDLDSSLTLFAQNDEVVRIVIARCVSEANATKQSI